MSIKIPSPSDIETHYLKAENRLYERLARNGLIASTLASLALILSIFLITELGFADTALFQFDSLYILRTSVNSVIALILFSLFGLRSRSVRRNAWYLFFALAFSSILGSLELARHTDSPVLMCIMLAIVPLLCALSWFYLKHKIDAGPRSEQHFAIDCLYSAVFLGLFGAACWVAFASANLGFFRYFWVSKIVLLWITTLIVARSPKLTHESLVIVLNPVHALRGALWPEQTARTDVDEITYRLLWWRGYCNLLLGFLIYGLLTWLSRAQQNPPSLFLNYIEFFLIDIAAFNILTGGARLFGYQVQDATRFVLLARTPADTWRRGSVYNYLFILRYIYLPVLRFVRSPFLTTVAAFSFFTLAHWGGSFLLLVASPSEPGMSPEAKLALGRILHVLAYATVVYITARHWVIGKERLANSALWQWLSVLTTHSIYIAFVYLIYVQVLGILGV